MLNWFINFKNNCIELMTSYFIFLIPKAKMPSKTDELYPWVSENLNIENTVTTHRSNDKIRELQDRLILNKVLDQHQTDNNMNLGPMVNLDSSPAFVEAPSASVFLPVGSIPSPLQTLMNSELELYNKVLSHIKDAVKDHEGIDALSAALDAYHAIDPQTVTWFFPALSPVVHLTRWINI